MSLAPPARISEAPAMSDPDNEDLKKAAELSVQTMDEILPKLRERKMLSEWSRLITARNLLNSCLIDITTTQPIDVSSIKPRGE